MITKKPSSKCTASDSLLLPHHPGLLAAHAHARLNRALDKNRNGTEPRLDALAHTTTQTGPVVCSALCLDCRRKARPGVPARADPDVTAR